MVPCGSPPGSYPDYAKANSQDSNGNTISEEDAADDQKQPGQVCVYYVCDCVCVCK